ncbi:MAG TPA: nucleotide exchange factor GrpE [Campylobacterales bacterium]|nr:nucleotide exchange factor GrpE [Campylobacterales bacterium]HIO70403.1 nucleotide exchange factor GrpE [Campylobacterales bacterium]
MEEKKQDETIEIESSQESSSEMVDELEAKLKECEDKYVRVFAEFENYKKRLEKEKLQAIEYSLENFAKDILPVLDHLHMAIKSAETDPNVEQLKEGVEITLKNFLSMLQKHGVEKIDTQNGFDPNLHEAVMRVDSDEVESGEIVEVLQDGYKLRERVLRATMVSIAN